MNDVASLRRWLYLILILAAILRFGFLMSDKVLPVMWDARFYACAAVGLISYIDDTGPEQSPNDRLDRYAFKYYYEKYIQGEKIYWQFYTPHSLTKARDDLFISGPLYPFMLAAIFYIAPVADFTFARILGIIFDLFSVWLIVLVALRLVGRRAAIVSGVLYAIYYPFIHTSTMLLLETSTNFFILLGIYLMIRGAETNRRWYLVMSGVICGLLVMHKPTAMLLIGPLVLGFYYYTRDKITFRQFLRRLMLIAVPAGVIFCSWLTVSSIKFDQLTLRDPSYAGANLRQSSSIDYEGYDLDMVEAEFNSRVIYGDLFGQAGSYIVLFAKKFERMWSRPYNDFKGIFLFPDYFVKWLHTFIILFGIVGMITLMFRNYSHAIWPIAICGYYTAIHLVFHSLNRYSFNALPLVIITAAWFGVLLLDKYLSRTTNHRLRITLGLLLLLFGILFQPTWLTLPFGSPLTYGFTVATLILKTVIWLTGIWLIVKVLWETGETWKRCVITVSLGLLFVTVTWVPALARDSWSEFSCQLEQKGVTIGKRIFISNLPPIDAEGIWQLHIDMNVPSGLPPEFNLKVWENTNNFILGREPLSRNFYPKPTYTEYARFEESDISSFRQYAIIDLAADYVHQAVLQRGFIDVSIMISPNSKPGLSMQIYGSQNNSPYIPSPRYTSVERHVHRGDPRIREAVNFLSDSTISYYIDGDDIDETSDLDLSPYVGQQSGRYNIFLIQTKPNGDILVY